MSEWVTEALRKYPMSEEQRLCYNIEQWIRVCISTGIVTPPPDAKPVPKIIRISTEDGEVIWGKPRRRMIQTEV